MAAVSEELRVSEFVWVLDPSEPMLGPVGAGSRIVAVTPPGCWGPMITIDFPAGHEVTRPVFITGAEPGDAVVVTIERIRVLTNGGTSGVHRNRTEHMQGKVPWVGKKCPGCGTVNPPSTVVGTGPGSIRCARCGESVQPCEMAAGYSMLLNEQRTYGLTVNEAVASAMRADPAGYMALPAGSRQHSANLLANGELPGVFARVEPMIGNIGTLPGCVVPSCHNSGDIAGRLLHDDHPNRLSEADLKEITDGHMDNNLVREGSTLVCPVRVPGAGLYLGDVHAMQSDGEIAGHTVDVTAEVTLKVELLKAVHLPGPLILPRPEELPSLVRPLRPEEMAAAQELSVAHGIPLEGPWVPLVTVGTGPTLNEGVFNGLERLATIMEWDVLEVRNRVTINGCIEIGRLPGNTHVGLLAPLNRIPHRGLRELLAAHYL